MNDMKTKTPVPDPSLPQPGESSWETLQDLWIDRVGTPVMFAGLLAMIAAVQWFDYFHKTSPWFWTAIFFAGSLFAGWRYWRTMPELRRRKQGIRGERIVGQLLENLRSVGCKVYHDVEEDGYNIDHVIIGPHGVFAIETKAPSKPAKGQSSVAFDGETVKVGTHKADPAPVVQAKASARRVRAILREMTGQEPNVAPVLLYVNWFVESYTSDISVIVMNQTHFYKSFDRLRNRASLPTAQVDQLAAGMERYLRQKQK
jgi:hypothetical protein